MVRFTSIILLHVCVDVLWPKPNNPLSVELLTPLDPIKLLSHGLHHIHISPHTVNHSFVQNRHSPSEKSIQAALYAVLNGLLPAPMSCLFEPKAKDRKQLDLIVVNGKDKLVGYELKVNNSTEGEIRKLLELAKVYASKTPPKNNKGNK